MFIDLPRLLKGTSIQKPFLSVVHESNDEGGSSYQFLATVLMVIFPHCQRMNYSKYLFSAINSRLFPRVVARFLSDIQCEDFIRTNCGTSALLTSRLTPPSLLLTIPMVGENLIPGIIPPKLTSRSDAE